MKKLLTIAIMILTASIAFAQNVSGTYYGVSNGADIVCKVTQTGSTIKGVLSDDASSYAFKGTYSNGYTKGTVVVDNAYTFNYTGTFSGSNFKATLIGQNGSITVSLSKNKPSNNSTANSSQQRDSRVVGNWMYENVVSSAGYGGYGDYASSVTVIYYSYYNDGTYIEEDKSAASGSNWSSSGVSGRQVGTWYTKNGYVYTTINGETSSTRYQFSNGRMHQGPNGKYILERR